MRRMFLFTLITFILSITGLLILYSLPNFSATYLVPLFWSAGGVSLGMLLGTYSRYRKNKILKKGTFLRICVICFISIGLSLIAFFYSQENSLFIIIPVNIIGLIIAAAILIKNHDTFQVQWLIVLYTLLFFMLLKQ